MLIIKVGISDGASLTSGSWMISESPTQWNSVLAVQMAKGRKQPKTKQRFSIIQLTGNLMLEQSSYQQLASPCPQQILSEA